MTAEPRYKVCTTDRSKKIVANNSLQDLNCTERSRVGRIIKEILSTYANVVRCDYSTVSNALYIIFSYYMRCKYSI